MADIVTFTRDQHRDRYLRFFKLRARTADTGPGGEPHALASADADAAMVLYGDAVTISRNVNLVDATGEDLLKKAEARGIDGKLAATGASGFVVVVAALGGGSIVEGTEIRHKPTGLRFECSVADTYVTGQLCPIRGVDTGTPTNLPDGSVLTWTSPPPGIGDTAVVSGDLTGGHPEESDEELIGRIIDLQKEPPASGNDAAIRKAVRDTPGVPVESAWTYPAIFGPGTMAVVATIRRDSLLATRLPNAAQLSTIEANLLNEVPYDDGIFVCVIQSAPVDVLLTVRWAKSTPGWTDGSTAWPPYVAPAGGPVRVFSSTSATEFTLYITTVTIADPQPGQTIGFYDTTVGKFRRKRIESATATISGQKWDIVCSPTPTVSDVSFVPPLSAVVSPWSDSLDTMVSPLLAYVATLGPGEQVDPLPDPGRRQRRQPESPDFWPSVITNRDLVGTFPRSVVADIVVQKPNVSTPYVTQSGSPGALSYLHALGEFGIFPQS